MGAVMGPRWVTRGTPIHRVQHVAADDLDIQSERQLRHDRRAHIVHIGETPEHAAGLRGNLRIQHGQSAVNRATASAGRVARAPMKRPSTSSTGPR